MIKKSKVHILALHLLILPGLAFSAERSVIVRFKQKPSHSGKALIHGARGKVRRTYQLIPAMAASLPEEEIEQLRNNSNVAYVEESAIYFAAAAPPPVDEYGNAWGVSHISADLAHADGNRGTGVKVAVIDTGIDYTHEDLDGNYIGGYDFVFDDNDPYDDSFNSHGTHVAGIIAAEENGVGVIGVAPEADIYAVKVLDGGGFGLVEWIIAGIEWAVQNGVDVINMSIEGPHRQALEDACDAAYNAGVLIVAAGGNSVAGGGPVEFPAAYDSVIAVTATDGSDLPAYFAPIGQEVELAAPGVDVLSTVAGGGYDAVSGTSQAAPHVAGAAALYTLSNTEDLTGDGLVNHQDVRLLLQLTATDLGNAGKDDVYGYGLVHAAGGGSSVPDTNFSLTRTSGPESDDAVVAEAAGMPYGIVITNHGLDRVAVDVVEGGDLRTDLSDTIRFGGKNRQENVFWLDATGTHYYVVFTPFGKPGRYAEIALRTDIERASARRRPGLRGGRWDDKHRDKHGGKHGDKDGGKGGNERGHKLGGKVSKNK